MGCLLLVLMNSSCISSLKKPGLIRSSCYVQGSNSTLDLVQRWFKEHNLRAPSTKNHYAGGGLNLLDIGRTLNNVINTFWTGNPIRPIKDAGHIGQRALNAR